MPDDERRDSDRPQRKRDNPGSPPSPRKRRTARRARYGDATPEDVARALLRYRPTRESLSGERDD